MVTVCTPSSRISARRNWSWSAWGMFVPAHFSTSRATPSTNTPSLPMSPVCSPATRRDRVEQRRGRALAGRARDPEAADASATGRRRAAPPPGRARAARWRRGPGARRAGRVRSTRSATAPSATACAAWACPSNRAPVRHAKHVPGRTRRLSSVMKATSTSASLTRSTTSRPASSSCHRTRARPLGCSTIRRPSGYRSPSTRSGAGPGRIGWSATAAARLTGPAGRAPRPAPAA